jgi:cell division protein FtsZ
MFQLMDTQTQTAVIKVIGVGGGGGNAVNHMAAANIEGVEFICANTDAQALENATVKTILQLGAGITKGLGAGADPAIGRKAAEEDRDRIKEALDGSDMIFITAGMGGGTGTGAAPVVAEVARELGILTVAVVTKPFPFEGGKRGKVAGEGIAELAKHVDSLITIPNDKLLQVLGKDMTLLNAFSSANDVLLNATQGIAELITRPGLINVDFADVKTVMSDAGSAVMGIGTATGDSRAQQAAEKAISSPLLETSMEGARGVLLSIAGPSDMTLHEVDTAASLISDHSDADANIIFGSVIDETLGDEMRVTVIAAGFDRDKRGSFMPTTTRSARSSSLLDSEPDEDHSSDGTDEMDIPGFVQG